FFLRDENGFLYARVGDSDASNWYRTIRPWSFLIRDVVRQTSRVSILDNVIDPRKGEETELHYILDKSGLVTIQVFNLGGDLVDVLYRGRRPAGEYTTSWNGRNQAGHIVARGIYFIRVTGPDIDEIRKIMVVK
ncbi:MAG: FlgD immunoglobulin-like domain containing protein, partial [Spirochaetota bacterium]|nr:FlgD immunoglobulin-like domain containing protein [Spirochaetota bacterium]